MAAESFTTLAILKARDEASAIWNRVGDAVKRFKDDTDETAASVKVSTDAIDNSLLKTASGADAMKLAMTRVSAAEHQAAEATKLLSAAEKELLDVSAHIAEDGIAEEIIWKKQAEAAAQLAAAEKVAARATKDLADAELRQKLIQEAMTPAEEDKIGRLQRIYQWSKNAGKAEDDEADKTKKLDRANKDANKSGDGMAWWMKALIGYAIPLAPALVGAGAGFAAFGAMALPEIKSITDGMATISQDQAAINTALTAAQKNHAVKQMAVDWAQIPPVQQKVILQAQAMEAQYKKMGQAVQPQVLGIFGSGLKFLTVLLPQVSKLAQIGGTALQNMVGKLATATSSKGAVQFFTMLDQMAQTALPLLGQLAGALGGLLAHALESLAPAAGPALQLLTDLIKALDGPLKVILPVLAGAFTKLVAAITPFLPQISDLLSQGLETMVPLLNEIVPLLIEFGQSALGQILQVVQSLGVPFRDFVGALGAFLRFISPLVPLLGRLVGWLLVAKTVIGAVKIAMAALNLVMDANPISLIVLAIAGLVAAFYLLWKNCAGFRDFWKAAWRDIKTVVSDVIGWVEGHWRLIISIILGPMGIVIALVTKYWKDIKQYFMDGVHGVEAVLNWFGSLPGKFSAWFTGVKNAAVDKLVDLVNWVTGLPGRLLHAVGDLGSLLYNVGKSILQGLWNGMKDMWNTVSGWVGGLGNWISNLKGPIEVDAVLLTPHGHQIMQGLMKGMKAEMPALQAQLGGITHTIQGTGGGLPVTSGASRPSGGVYVDLRGSQVMTERDMDLLVSKVGRALAVRTLPSGGVRVKM